MKKIKLSYKQTKFLMTYFWWVGPIYFIGTLLLTYHISGIFRLGDKLSFPLYECPGFILCFIDHIPIIGRATIVLKEPLLVLAGTILFLIIIVPPMWIFMNMLTFEGKNKSK